MRKIFRKTHDPIWHLQLGVAIIIGLQIVTAHSFFPVHKVALIVFELALLLALTILTSDGYHAISRKRRTFAMVLIVIVTAANIFSLIILLQALVNGTTDIDGYNLLVNAVTIYVTNIFIFALWYWEMDGGGPERRAGGTTRADFLFPQMIHKKVLSKAWLPGFIDYLYLSSTNVTNFAAADTVPLSHRAKVLMMVQSLVSVVTVVLVAARAISIMQ